MLPSQTRSRWPFAGVVLANLASLAVVGWTGWRAHVLLVVYWLEAGIVSGVYAAKILRAEGTDDPEQIRSWAAFDGKPADRYVGEDNRMVADAVLLHFAGPWLVWGALILFLGWSGAFEPADPVAVALATVGLVAYHVSSYYVEYVGYGEYERRGPVSLFVELAPRHLAVVLTWMFGAGAVAITGTPIGAILVLFVCKTCVDLVAVRRERRLAAA